MDTDISKASEGTSLAVVEQGLNKSLSVQEYKIRVWEGSHVRVTTKKLTTRLDKIELIALASLILDIANNTEHATELKIS